MARTVEEIMNRELLAVAPETPAQAIFEVLRTFAIGAVPVVDDEGRPLGLVTAGDLLDAVGGTARDRMSQPANCIEGSTTIEEAARHIGLADVHHLVVVDCAGVAVGMLSVLDVMRAMVGIASRHPAAFPHWDAATASAWTDEWPIEKESVSRAPDAAGVLVLVRSGAGAPDTVVWVEQCRNVRDRVAALAALSSSGEPALARLLERHDVCFRAATVCDDGQRERIASRLQYELEHTPPPGSN
jgi:CBS domain-containing protein